MFIVLEGADAVGKQTQSELLVELFRDRGRKAKRVAFHRYETPLGRVIRSHLTRDVILAHNAPTTVTQEHVESHPEATVSVRPDPHEADPMVFQCMGIVDKYEGAGEIVDFVAEGGVVICDRWWQSAYAYGAADGVQEDWLLNAHRFLPCPDFNFLLTLSRAEALRRRPIPEDRYEANEGVQERVRVLYDRLWDSPPAFGAGKWIRVDGHGTARQVSARILKHIC